MWRFQDSAMPEVTKEPRAKFAKGAKRVCNAENCCFGKAK